MTKQPGDNIGLDFIVPVDKKHILAKVDFLSRKVQLEACELDDTENVLRGLDSYLQTRGAVRRIVIDGVRHLEILE